MSVLNEFCADFGVAAPEPITRLGKRCFLTRDEDAAFIAAQKTRLVAAGLYLGEEQKRMRPSPALVAYIAAQTDRHKVVVDEKAEWLFLCGRDVFAKAIISQAKPTKNGLVLVNNHRGENLGYGKAMRKGQVVVKNLLDRGEYLRRERG